MNICESLTRTARIFPDRIALVAGNLSLSYTRLDRLSQQAAGLLRKLGIGQGDRVALMLPNTPSFAVWYYGALRLGAVAVSISTRLTASEVEYMLADCGAVAFVTADVPTGQLIVDQVGEKCPHRILTLATGEFSTGQTSAGRQAPMGDAQLKSAWQHSEWHMANDWDAAPDDPALILYTSGTTGFAKGATLSHGNVRSNVHAFNHLCKMRSDDRILIAVPLFHCFGQNALLNSGLNVGATLVLQDKFDLNLAKQLIAQHGITQLYGVPMMFQLLHDICDRPDLASVRYCFSAAATLPIQTAENWCQKFGMPIHEGYGLTETSPFASYNHRDQFVPGSIGTPIDNCEMRIVDTETGVPCKVGELGEITIRGPNVMLGYWNRSDETANAIRDGWFHSGDIGRVDQRGYFYIVDRVKDMITVGGLKVFPAEVERVLLDHPSVQQTAVVGIEDSVFGEQVVAFIVLSDVTSDTKPIDDIIRHANEHLGNYKRPRRFLRIETLPRNPSGKVLKTELRKIAAESLEAATLNEQLQPTTEKVRTAPPANLASQIAGAFITQHHAMAVTFVTDLVMRLAAIDQRPEPTAKLLELGLDSLLIVELAAEIRNEIGGDRELPATLVFDYPTISELATFLVETLTAGESTPDADANKPAVGSVHPDLHSQIQQMSDQQALDELLRELQ